MADSQEPHWIRAEGWQLTDESHPPNGGAAAYRLVFKTLRLVLPPGEMGFSNLLVRWGHGKIDRGGMLVPGALPARRPRHWILPEFGRLVPDGEEQLRYEPDVNMHYEFRAWQDELQDVFFVEFILETEATEADAMLAEGRNKLGSMKTMLDLRFGPRLLGLQLLEELGEIYPDGHFARSLRSESVGAESQLDVGAIEQDDLLAWIDGDLDRHMQRTTAERQRLGLACEWYWNSLHDADQVTAYLGLWFVLEVLAMPTTTDVAPVRERLATELGGAADDWKKVINPLRNLRGAVVHGGKRSVTDDDVARLREVVEAFLEFELSQVQPTRADRLRTQAGVS